MPIYAYRCEDCGHAQDFLQKISDPLIDTCPNCGSKNFRKQLTAAGFQLKGGGWYVTDFRDGGKKDGKGTSGTATASTPSGSGESKSEGAKSDGSTSSSAGGTSAASSSGSSGSSGGSTTSGSSSGGTKAA